jgi:hypothetical protein
VTESGARRPAGGRLLSRDVLYWRMGIPIGTNEKRNMAQVTKVRLVDDIDGSEADESVEFTLDGMSLEIDLSKDNAAKLRDILAPYVAAGRRGDRRPARRQQRVERVPAVPAAPRESTGPIREWAAANGFTVSDRGRISAEVTEAYQKWGERRAEKPARPKIADPFQVTSV